ncbi:hypothetical protein AJ78_00968 [Emergomyces pasteurianus Ep9510]|uniref:ER-bound oxygenase mpaB/mpaB'/Rubber oxygenase catalytic domain-containing protein n=1 Tax=Emergomyces pasteurianus Ep9510 TaxID=1447872 RepID=A0A1J9QUZ6_9EURO|nr:hypothetical protein AJ78_00968 [Emergomyces pasteurianus Ep9510]
MSSITDYSAINSLAQKLLTTAKAWAPNPIFGAAVYLFGVALLRNRRIKKNVKKYKYTTRESMAAMSDDDAWEILKVIAEMEFPFIYIKALQFALFRTYGIPTISKTLVQTGQFAKPQFSMKRYADTTVLISEIVGNAPSSERAHAAISRINYLHQGYRMSGKILDDDMLYTLSMFTLEPIRWINRYEWRKASDMEICAAGTFWKSVGDAMEISFEHLPSAKTGFKDGIHFFEELKAWSEDYEERAMVPNEWNRKNADQTVAVLLWDYPNFMKPVTRNMVLYMMDDRLREAMMYEKPHVLYHAAFTSIFKLRTWFLRHLCLPRPEFMRYRRLTPGISAEPRYNVAGWEGAPFYVKPGFMNRWGLRAWYTWLRGKPLPGDNPDHCPQGYYIADVGPKNFEGKGHDQLKKTRERLQKERTGQCPFLPK